MHYNRLSVCRMKKFFFIVSFLAVSLMYIPLYSQDKKETVPASVVEEDQLPELSIVDNVLYVKNAPVGAKIEIITIVGSKVKEIKVRYKNDTYELNLPRAIYIFKLEGVVRKFVIR